MKCVWVCNRSCELVAPFCDRTRFNIHWAHNTTADNINIYSIYIYEIYVSNIVLFYFYFFFFARHNFAYIIAPANSNKQTNAIQMRPVLWLQYDICCGFYRNKFRSPIDNFNRPSSLNIEHTTNIDITFFYVFFVFYSTLLRTCTALSTHTTHHSKYTPYTYFVFFFFLFICAVHFVCVSSFYHIFFFTACLFIEIMNLLALADHHSHVHTLIHVYQWFCDILALLFDA